MFWTYRITRVKVSLYHQYYYHIFITGPMVYSLPTVCSTTYVVKICHLMMTYSFVLYQSYGTVSNSYVTQVKYSLHTSSVEQD